MAVLCLWKSGTMVLQDDRQDDTAVKTTDNVKWVLLIGAGLWASPALARPDLQQQAEAALVAGDPAQTATIARTILAASPDSFAGLYLLGLAQMELGAPEQAAMTGQTAYDIAPTEEARFQAARLVASARFQSAQFIRAEFWLRRAANHAETEQDARSVVLAYVNTVRANPLSVDFTAFVAPTDNVNNGSEEGVLRLESIGLTFDLPEDRRSLSGLAFGLDANIAYRLSETPDQATYLTGGVSGETYLLSSAAKELLASSPDAAVRAVDGRDFETLIAEIGLRRDQSNLSPLGPVSFGIKAGTFWEGGERLVNYQELALEQILPVDQDTSFGLGLSVRDQQSLSPLLLDSTTYDVTGRYDRALPNGDLLQLSALVRKREAGPESTFEEYQIGVGYGFSEPVHGMQLSAALQLGHRNYAEFATTLDGRRDHYVNAEVHATFVAFSYFGFSPRVSLSARRTESSAEENTSAAAQLLFGVTSNF